jgi:hypothetical protein
MLFLAAMITAASLDEERARPVGASVQARATIRILSGVELHFGRVPENGSYIVRESTVRAADAERQRAKLVEFQ